MACRRDVAASSGRLPEVIGAWRPSDRTASSSCRSGLEGAEPRADNPGRKAGPNVRSRLVAGRAGFRYRQAVRTAGWECRVIHSAAEDRQIRRDQQSCIGSQPAKPRCMPGLFVPSKPMVRAQVETCRPKSWPPSDCATATAGVATTAAMTAPTTMSFRPTTSTHLHDSRAP